MRVVEAAAFVAAPLGGMTLAQMGADVIRIDTLGGGLDHGRWPVTENGTSLFWCGLNKSKRSVALDLASAEGRELAMAIVCAPGDDAGMLLTNFPPRGWLSYETLSARRADLIQLTLVRDDRSCSEANPMLREVEQAGVGRYRMPGIPLDFSAVERLPPGPAPLLGQHTEEVRLDLLGLSAAAYGELHDRGVVRAAASSTAGRRT